MTYRLPAFTLPILFEMASMGSFFDDAHSFFKSLLATSVSFASFDSIIVNGRARLGRTSVPDGLERVPVSALASIEVAADSAGTVTTSTSGSSAQQRQHGFVRVYETLCHNISLAIIRNNFIKKTSHYMLTYTIS